MSSPGPIRISPGDVIDDFEILEVLALGGSSATFRATHLALAREVVFKFVYPAVFSGDRGAIDAARADATRVARLEHPAVAPVFGAGAHEGGLYIVSALTKGRTLAELGAERSITPVDVARVLADVAAALAVAHEQGVVHHDLRPDCITVDRWGHGVVSDFGITRVSGRTGLLTRAEILESLRYTAPEVVLGRTASGASDVYGLAAVAVWCLTGAAPYRDRPTGEYVQFRTTAPAPTLTLPDGDAARDVNAALAAAMALTPEARPAPTEFAGALARAVAGLPPSMRATGCPLIGSEAPSPGLPAAAALVLPSSADATRVEHRRPLAPVSDGAPEQRPWATYAACAMIAAAVGLGGLLAGRASRAEPPPPIAIAGFSLAGAETWRRVPGARGAAPGLVRVAGLPGETATLGVAGDLRLPGDPLPAGRLAGATQPPAHLRSGRVALVRYAAPGGHVYARPTTKGTFYATCSKQVAPGRCAALVVHAAGPGRDVAVAPSKALGDALAQAMKAIEQETGRRTVELQTRSKLAGAVQGIATQLDTVASGLGAEGIDAGTAAELERLRAALAAERDALVALSSAVDQRSAAAFADAREQARASRAKLRSSLDAFRRAGYDVAP